ncbi:MAG TPA: hypothetical protein VK601_09310, partial [Kofleriaceae bacterium]|nr:hypothetical protein [Kofleriaceae bacterium]
MRARLALLAAAGCVDHTAGISGTQSIAVELVSPADPGAIDRRLPDGTNVVKVNLTAYDESHSIDTGFDRDVQVYVQFLGTVTPTPTLSDISGHVTVPLATFHLSAGAVVNQTVTLPATLGPTTLWVEDGPKAKPDRTIDPAYTPTYATGTSPILWFRDPFIADIQRP